MITAFCSCMGLMQQSPRGDCAIHQYLPPTWTIFHTSSTEFASYGMLCPALSSLKQASGAPSGGYQLPTVDRYKRGLPQTSSRGSRLLLRYPSPCIRFESSSSQTPTPCWEYRPPPPWRFVMDPQHCQGRLTCVAATVSWAATAQAHHCSTTG